MKHKRPDDIQELFVYFVQEREKARLAKEAGEFPTSTDPIIATYRFCNVNREHDAVTRWIAENVRSLELSHEYMVLNLCAARIFNEPPVLRHVLPFKDSDRLLFKVAALKKQGKQARIFRGAYMMPVHGNNGGGCSAITYWCDNLKALKAKGLSGFNNLGSLAEKIASVKGFGGFLANQVCADLRYTKFYPRRSTEDWETYVSCGPGSVRGIQRYYEIGSFGPNRAPIGRGTKNFYADSVLKIRDEISGDLDPVIQEYFLDPNNVSNCFCEFDKFCRALDIPEGDTRHRIALRKYTKP
jgi:hypothetical protein